MDNVYAFTDEYGAFGWDIDNPSVSTHFIITAIIVKESDLSDFEQKAEILRKKHFQTGEIKSTKIGKITNEDSEFYLISIMIKKEKYCVELNDNGVICGLFQAHHMSEFNLAHGGLGEICLTATDHQPRYQVRNANSFPSEGVPPKEFVSVLDFVPQFHLVSNDGSRFQYQNDDYHATLQYQFHNDCFSVRVSAQDPRIVQFGMNLRFSFLGADPETLAHQLVASTPYTSEDGSVTFFLMPRADGQFVLVTSSGNLNGWKLDYSEYNYGHFILNLKMLEQLDTCYKMPHSQEIHNMTLWVDFPASPQEAYDLVFKRTGVPCASFNISGGLIGTTIPIQIHGVCDRILLSTPTGAQQDLVRHGAYATVPLQEEGF